jgi:hypothetical protein
VLDLVYQVVAQIGILEKNQCRDGILATHPVYVKANAIRKLRSRVLPHLGLARCNGNDKTGGFSRLESTSMVLSKKNRK